MDGLHEMTASGVPAKIGGVIYHLLPLRAKDWGEAARHLSSLRRPALELVKSRLAGLAEGLQKHLLELAYREERHGDLLSVELVERWFQTPEGRVFRFWLMLRRQQPEMTLDGAEELILKLGAEELAALARSERDNEGLPLGNSSGQAPAQAATSRSLGGESSAS